MYPDSINQENFPNDFILRPGNVYKHDVNYKFYVETNAIGHWVSVLVDTIQNIYSLHILHFFQFYKLHSSLPIDLSNWIFFPLYRSYYESTNPFRSYLKSVSTHAKTWKSSPKLEKALNGWIWSSNWEVINLCLKVV